MKMFESCGSLACQLFLVCMSDTSAAGTHLPLRLREGSLSPIFCNGIDTRGNMGVEPIAIGHQCRCPVLQRYAVHPRIFMGTPLSRRCLEWHPDRRDRP
jgi:hypothetical protein